MAHAHQHQHQHGAPSAHAHSHDSDATPNGLPEILDLDAALFAPHLTALTGRIACLAGDDVRHIVDLGSGTGTGTFALLEQFPTARVTAVDSSPAMLERLVSAARERGLGDRVRTLEADAGAGLPGVVDADLVWASASLHHLDDPATGLAGIRAALRPGGLLAVAEVDGMPSFLPAGSGPGELEARCRTALDGLHAERMPHRGADWGSLLTAAGFSVEQERAEPWELRAPLPEGAGRYAFLVFERIRGSLDGRVSDDDLAALDRLIDGGPEDVRHRDDLVVRSTRRTWMARPAQETLPSRP
ncbi:class I SAM-dependent methyltransferase [Streptomyces sp. MBT56]|uniref:class I SAM-dependent methyltransferase n=1 Tax=unclassified Streptomyces TaxID=2593676 RepID=UPI00190DE3DF|nr:MULTISPECIES: class I SAM-dependent methyltransferase [unclassified Streptomyces]MBK3555308.1 class I SAM-dependent methyltransferase [Streptomyces sp. MBT56]MBK3600962.1 class I SAM-dependent methyltransferase [Streptomyces sp. MBT54]MBK3613758.1 class I SAM-dependent methyltransferase [Streptomyces sp. MBT98]